MGRTRMTPVCSARFTSAPKGGRDVGRESFPSTDANRTRIGRECESGVRGGGKSSRKPRRRSPGNAQHRTPPAGPPRPALWLAVLALLLATFVTRASVARGARARSSSPEPLTLASALP